LQENGAERAYAILAIYAWRIARQRRRMVRLQRG
jgi:hypothetical protein